MIGLQEFGPNLRGQVAPGGRVNVALGANYTIFDQSKAAQGGKNLQYCRLQNIGTKKLLVNINDIATAEEFVAILAADTAAGAGNGGIIEIPGSWSVTLINVFNPDGAGSTDVAIILITNVSNARLMF